MQLLQPGQQGVAVHVAVRAAGLGVVIGEVEGWVSRAGRRFALGEGRVANAAQQDQQRQPGDKGYWVQIVMARRVSSSPALQRTGPSVKLWALEGLSRAREKSCQCPKVWHFGEEVEGQAWWNRGTGLGESQPAIDHRQRPGYAWRMGTLYYGDNLDILRRHLKDDAGPRLSGPAVQLR